MVFNEPWGRWGVGVSGTLPTGADGLTTDKWTAGPALGFVNSSNKQYNWGLFTQTFFSFAGKTTRRTSASSTSSPSSSYQLGEGRSLSLGNSALVYDTERSRWVVADAGSVNYGHVVGCAGHKWRPNIEVDYDFKRRSAAIRSGCCARGSSWYQRQDNRVQSRDPAASR